MKYTFVTGADDPEMEMIEQIVTSHGHTVIHAYFGGKRVQSSTAYSADEFRPELPSDSERLVWVECGPVDPSQKHGIVVDHHNEGDPGYDASPADYWKGSSLGQVCTLLGIEPNKHLLLAAASDHCLHAAYRGECPGVNPNELRSWRLSWRAQRHRMKKYQLVARINKAIKTINELSAIDFHGQPVLDAMNLAIPELGEAAAIQGKAVLYSYFDSSTQMPKVGLTGARPEVIAAWMETIAQNPQVVRVYGNPHRGYAGAYLNPELQVS